MKKKLTLEEIRKFWEEQATKHGISPKASWSDQMVIEMEIKEILKHLEDNDRVLDIGCGNGYSTVQFAFQRRILIKGIDYIPEMIKQAHRRLNTVCERLLGKVKFGVGDILDLHEPRRAYDKVIVIRVLINLGNWQNQLKGLSECARVLKRGGMLLLSEATLQGWDLLNSFRKEWGLLEIPMPAFNQYLDQDKLIAALSKSLKFVELVNFSSTYYIGTRLLKPLLIKALRLKIDVADPNMEWNRWFAQLPAWGDYGVQKLFVFRKI